MIFFKTNLRDFPKPFKALAFAYCCGLGLAYVYAVANIALVIGLTPNDIAIHYYGSKEKISAPQAGAEEALNLDNLDSVPAAENHPRPSLKNLVAEGHFHLFGMSSFFFGLCLLGLFTRIADGAKTVMVSLPFLFVIVDNLSFMATRYLGPQVAFLTAIAGAGMGISFTWLWVAVVREVISEGSAES